MTKWQYLGDVDTFQCGGTFYRCIGDRKYLFVVFINFEEHSRNYMGEFGAHYQVDVRYLDMKEITNEQIEQMRNSMSTPLDTPEEQIAFDLQDYGLYANIESFSGHNAKRLLARGKRCANEYNKDRNALERQLERPVNKIGSTAREMMKGDMDSALLRGLAKGDPVARILGKIQGL